MPKPQRLPAHALAEIKRDPKQRAFWDRWAAVGEAKDAAREAAVEMYRVAEEWRKCRARGDFPDRPGPECACGKHADRYLAARKARDAAIAAIDAAIDEFKAGDKKTRAVTK